jgi:glutaredoxin
MTTHQEAKRISEKQGAQFVVYVFDDGEHIYEADQVRRYKNLILIEACYMEGRQVPESVWQRLVTEAA